MDAATDTQDLPTRFDALGQVVQDLRYSRPMLRSFFDTWIRQRDIANDCPGFLYGIASVRDRLGSEAANPANDASAPVDPSEGQWNRSAGPEAGRLDICPCAIAHSLAAAHKSGWAH